MKEYSYNQLLEQAKRDGVVTEQKMWQSACQADKYMQMAQNGALTNDRYWAFMREQQELFYGPHYNEDFALYDVSMLRYTGKSNDRRTGEHWTKQQIEDATKDLAYPQGTTCWDKYVAFNVFYSDLCLDLDEETIIKAAHRFFFQDEDGPIGKIWHYMNCVRTQF